jgi:peroxiredoxin
MMRNSCFWKIALLLSLCLSLTGCEENLVVLKKGDPAPPFSLVDLLGREVRLETFRGKIVMLRFWADWCKACYVEMPLIDKKFLQFKDQGFEVLALNVKQSEKTAERFVKYTGIHYKVILDSDGTTSRNYGVLALPTTFMVDGEGVVKEEIIGDMNMKALSALIDPYFVE